MRLVACDDWESVAASSVSLRSASDQIHDLLLKWRKMEISSWHFLLADAEIAAARTGFLAALPLWKLLHDEVKKMFLLNLKKFL